MPTPTELEYQKTMGRLASQAGMVDPTTVQQALSSGGTLSNSFGFNSGQDLLGLTPEDVQNLVANRSQVINQNLGTLKGAAEAVDAVTGKTEADKLQQRTAENLFSA